MLNTLYKICVITLLLISINKTQCKTKEGLNLYYKYSRGINHTNQKIVHKNYIDQCDQAQKNANEQISKFIKIDKNPHGIIDFDVFRKRDLNRRNTQQQKKKTGCTDINYARQCNPSKPNSIHISINPAIDQNTYYRTTTHLKKKYNLKYLPYLVQQKSIFFYSFVIQASPVILPPKPAHQRFAGGKPAMGKFLPNTQSDHNRSHQQKQQQVDQIHLLSPPQKSSSTSKFLQQCVSDISAMGKFTPNTQSDHNTFGQKQQISTTASRANKPSSSSNTQPTFSGRRAASPDPFSISNTQLTCLNNASNTPGNTTSGPKKKNNQTSQPTPNHLKQDVTKTKKRKLVPKQYALSKRPAKSKISVKTPKKASTDVAYRRLRKHPIFYKTKNNNLAPTSCYNFGAGLLPFPYHAGSSTTPPLTGGGSLYRIKTPPKACGGTPPINPINEYPYLKRGLLSSYMKPINTSNSQRGLSSSLGGTPPTKPINEYPYLKRGLISSYMKPINTSNSQRGLSSSLHNACGGSPPSKNGYKYLPRGLISSYMQSIDTLDKSQLIKKLLYQQVTSKDLRMLLSASCNTPCLQASIKEYKKKTKCGLSPIMRKHLPNILSKRRTKAKKDALYKAHKQMLYKIYHTRDISRQAVKNVLEDIYKLQAPWHCIAMSYGKRISLNNFIGLEANVYHSQDPILIEKKEDKKMDLNLTFSNNSVLNLNSTKFGIETNIGCQYETKKLQLHNSGLYLTMNYNKENQSRYCNSTTFGYIVDYGSKGYAVVKHSHGFNIKDTTQISISKSWQYPISGIKNITKGVELEKKKFLLMHNTVNLDISHNIDGTGVNLLFGVQCSRIIPKEPVWQQRYHDLIQDEDDACDKQWNKKLFTAIKCEIYCSIGLNL